ncbi:MAG TPA: VWA domain-containing protein [Acidothermaceae bacterium]|nr:VWA domain-containing protein [Acidothermaceae bacterium]
MTATLLSGVDRAAFAVALADRLRSAGVDVGLPAASTFARALAAQPPSTRTALYWLARVTLTHRHSDVEVFDRVFAAVFDHAGLNLDPHSRRQAPARSRADDDRFVAASGDDGVLGQDGGGLPWATLPAVVGVADDEPSPVGIPERLPSNLAGIEDTPFEELSADQLALLGVWLEQAFRNWPSRRTRRVQAQSHGRYINLRATMVRSRRSGWEVVHVVRSAPRYVPRRVVMVCDISQSMQAYATMYLHLMRAAVSSADAEVFAFGTTLTRLTPVLTHRSVDVAIEQASAKVVDRFGGTRIASNLDTLLRSRHNGVLRGAVVVIASDGWDSDPPLALAASMARLRRRAHRVIWLNPRVAATGFAPLVGSMAAALPYCDDLLPAHDLRALGDAFDTVARVGRRSRPHGGWPSAISRA